ncbi:MAG: prepilin peptidase [Candidatus Altiarchaeota archaeon]|nr:prepilin peptidase [Candidatus Altiarchaeota archaeon]
MMLELFTLSGLVVSVTLLFLLAASWFDLRTGEIPDEVSIGLSAVMLLASGAYSIISGDFSFVSSAFIVGLLYFIFGYGLHYLGEWGGGDVKLIAGVGCALGFLKIQDYLNEGMMPYYVDYLINIALMASPYVLLYTLVLGLMKPSVFSLFRKTLSNKIILFIVFFSFIPSVSAYFLDLGSLVFMYLMIPVLVVLSVYLKTVEKEALQKTVGLDELMVEDVVAQDLVVDGVKIASSRDISGLSGEDIARIRELHEEGKIPSELRVKWGVRFAPIFLFAFLLSITVGNALEVLVRYFAGL